MQTAILLCAMLAADPSQVQAKVLYGTAAEQQQSADIEPWISRAVQAMGSPLAQPHSDWNGVSGELKRLYTSPQGGFIIDGKAIEREGTYEVEINACAGIPFDKEVFLKPGKRQVINLTENPGRDNVFIALEAPVTEQARKRAEQMKADAKSFRLELLHQGEQGKPFYRLTISVPVIDRLAIEPFHRIAQIDEKQAVQIIDHLARDGFFDKAVDMRNKTKRQPPVVPSYTMRVIVDDLPLFEELGWDLPMLKRLDALREVLPDNAQKDMDLLLGRMSGLRKQWEEAANSKN